MTTPATTAATTAPKSRYDWVDFSKGFCILAVVTLYTTNYVGEAVGSGGWLDIWVAFAKPFRMPDFFLLSGLFLGRVIDRPWLKYLDTKVVHYVYFLVVWTIIVVPFIWTPEQWATMTPIRAVKSIFFWNLYNPWAQLWFIQMLAIYFVVTRLVRRVPWPVVFIVAALLQVFPYHTGIIPVDVFGERYVFFYMGYAMARHVFSYADWVQNNHRSAVVMLVVWTLLECFFVFGGYSELTGMPLILGFVGSFAVITLGVLLSRYQSLHWVQFLGANSIVVYLGFYLPMRGLIWLAVHYGVPLDDGTLAAVVAVLCVAITVGFWWVTRRTFLSFLFQRPRWARIPERYQTFMRPGVAAASLEKR